MNKELTPLEALEDIIIDFKIDREALDFMDNTRQKDIDYGKKWLKEREDIVKKSLKALEIMKEYGVDVYWLMKYDFIQYQYRTQSDIPEDKFNFVKEVLCGAD